MPPELSGWPLPHLVKSTTEPSDHINVPCERKNIKLYFFEMFAPRFISRSLLDESFLPLYQYPTIDLILNDIASGCR